MLCRSIFCLVNFVIVLLAITGCTDIVVSQRMGEVIIRDGQNPTPKHGDVGQMAADILPYALIADQTYRDGSYRRQAPLKPYPPLTKCSPDCDPEEQAAAKILANWRLVAALKDKFGRPSGLAVQVWAEGGKTCREVVIAFRGTELSKGGNWVSNLHWLARIFGVSDQYTQVRYNMRNLIDFAQSLPCFDKGRSKITVAGHSLGGGLALHAGYVDGRIDNIYAFDPSFVTGSWDGYFTTNPSDPGLKNRKENEKGLTVKRIYEHGEILAYVRFFTRHINPPTPIDPHVILIRFNVVDGNIFKQHKLIVLDTCLIAETYSKDGSEQQVRRERVRAVCADE